MVEDGELNCCKATYDGVVLLPWSFAMLACAGRVVRTLSTCKPYLWSLSIIEKALRNSFRVWSESCVSREDTITLKSRNRSLSAFITVGLGLPCAFVAATFADDRRRSAASCAAPPPPIGGSFLLLPPRSGLLSVLYWNRLRRSPFTGTFFASGRPHGARYFGARRSGLQRSRWMGSLRGWGVAESL